MRFRDLPLRTDVYGREPDVVEAFEAVDSILLERLQGDRRDHDARRALAHLHDVLREQTRRVAPGLSTVDLDSAVASMRDHKAALCCLAQRAFVCFWMGRLEKARVPHAGTFLELYKGYLQAFYDTFIDVPESEKEPGNRRYNAIMLSISSSDPLLRSIGKTVVNDIAASLFQDVSDAALSKHIWNALTTAYYAGESRFGINVFVENYDGYLRDLLFYFDASKDYVANAIVERFVRSSSDDSGENEPFRMLEPGAGTGDMLFRILDRMQTLVRTGRLSPERAVRFRYLGFDLSEEMRGRFEERRARSAYSEPSIETVLAKAALLAGDAIDRDSWPREIEERSFDLASVIFMLHHVYPPRRRSFMEHAVRAVRPDGWFVFLEGTEEHKWFKPYHDPQDVEALEYFEVFDRVLDGSYVDGVALEEQRFFPEIEMTEPDGSAKTSGWAVASVGSVLEDG